MSEYLLRVKDLHVEFTTRNGRVCAVRGVSLALSPGATLGIVGESGSGKSVTAYAITKLLDRAGRITGGSIEFGDSDLVSASYEEMRRLRGPAISMIFQNARGALNPIRTIGQQLVDALSAHRRLSKEKQQERVLDLLAAVMLKDPERILRSYPHQLSGGMCQRAMIALAIACEPQLLIADEPTTGLDVTTQKTVMDLVARLATERKMGVILITHDLGLAARYCQNIAVMQEGVVVETAPATQLFGSPQHPYTRRLVAASPTAHSTLDDLGVDAESDGVPSCRKTLQSPRTSAARPLLTAKDLTKDFSGFRAVDSVSFDIAPGESVGLVGESGSGKSTISRIISRLIDKSQGSVVFDGHDIGDIPASDFHGSEFRRQIQIVFQDPHESLNPRYTAFDCIAHPLRRLDRLIGKRETKRRVEECAERVEFDCALLTRFPHQLSGGQKARVGIARAIATNPRLLILDEPTAALDVSVQAVVLKLLDRLRREEGLSFFFVSHDLNVVRMLCERIIVMASGRVVEEASSLELFRAPQTAYTRELLEAIPSFDPRRMREIG